MRRSLAVGVALVSLVSSVAGCAAAGAGGASPAPALARAPEQSAPARNVIFLLTDGTGPEAWPLVRWVKGGPLNVDAVLTGAVRTYGADSIITDSAPGATAYATGYKGSDKGISVGAWNVTIAAAEGRTAPAYVPMATILEGARVGGRAVGLVATSNVQHATPAAFSSHWHDRNDYPEIAEQQVYQGLDVVLSGGLQYLLPAGTADGKRKDGEDLTAVLRGRGYALVETRAAMAEVHAGKVWGAFAPDAMAFDIDRAATAPTQPSLGEMTSKALELLSGSERGRTSGFFLFVEGSKVDWGAHSNDPSAVVSDLLAFDEAVGVALDFARRDGRTLVVAVADHGTGGISIGVGSDKNYSQTDDDSVVGPLRKVRLTAEGIEATLKGDRSEEGLRRALAEQWGLTDVTAEELGALRSSLQAGAKLKDCAGPLLSRRARIGWTSGGHTGADVFLFSFGPGQLAGLWQNVDVGRAMGRAMGFELAALEQRLFVEAEQGLREIGYTATLDASDAENPVLVARKGDVRAELPLSKNLLRVDGKTVELEGVVVQAKKLGKVYVPRQAIELLAARKE